MGLFIAISLLLLAIFSHCFTNSMLAWGDHMPNLGDAERNMERLGRWSIFFVESSVTAGLSSSCSAY